MRLAAHTLSLILYVFLINIPEAWANQLRFVSNFIDNSTPGAEANHTIRFTTVSPIPVSGKITIFFEGGAFSIPAGLDHTDVDLAVNGFNRSLAASPGNGNNSPIGVSIVNTSTDSRIVFTLNNANSISEGSQMTITIGTKAGFNAIGDKRLISPARIGTYRIYLKTTESDDALLDLAETMVAIVGPVSVTAEKISFASSTLSFSPSAATTTIFKSSDNSQLNIFYPAGFVDFSDNVSLRVDAYKKEDYPLTQHAAPATFSAVGKIYDIKLIREADQSQITTFNKSVTFDFFYLDFDIYNLDENTLKVYTLASSGWSEVSGSTVHPAENRISISVTHLSVFSIFGQPTTTPTPTQPTPTSIFSSGGGGGAPTPPKIDIGLPESILVSPLTGQTIKQKNIDGSSMTLTLQPNFLKSTVTFNITTILRRTATSITPPPPSLDIVGDRIYSILVKDLDNRDVKQFDNSAFLSLHYTDAQAADFDEQAFKLYSINPTLNKWEPIFGSAVDTEQNIVSGSITHLTLFTIIGKVGRPITKRIADFSGDGRVDLVDFSILLYNWGIPKRKEADINGDLRIDLIDFSIMLYWWTG